MCRRLGLKEALRRDDRLLPPATPRRRPAGRRWHGWGHAAAVAVGLVAGGQAGAGHAGDGAGADAGDGPVQPARRQEALQDSQLRKSELMAHSTAGRLGQLLADSGQAGTRPGR
jgi:hypothetical protein